MWNSGGSVNSTAKESSIKAVDSATVYRTWPKSYARIQALWTPHTHNHLNINHRRCLFPFSSAHQINSRDPIRTHSATRSPSTLRVRFSTSTSSLGS